MWDSKDPQGSIKRAALAYKTDPAVALRVATIENGRFDPFAKNPKSSATGLYQHLDGTWKGLGGTPEDRTNPNRQLELGMKGLNLTRQNLVKALQRDVQPHEQYMGHLLGDVGAQRFLTAAPNDMAINVALSYDPKNAAAIINNNGMQGMTVAQAIDKWKGKFGNVPQTQQPTPAAPMQTPAPAEPTITTAATEPAARAPMMPQMMMQDPMAIQRGAYTADDAAADQQKAARQRAMAQALQQQAVMGHQQQYTPGGMAVRQNPMQSIARALQLYATQDSMNGADSAEKGSREKYSAALSSALDQLNQANTPREAPVGTGQTGGLDGPAGDVGPMVQMPNPANVKAAAGELGRVSGGQQAVAQTMLANALAGKQVEYDTKPQYDQQGRAYVQGKDGSTKYLNGVSARDELHFVNQGAQTAGVNKFTGLPKVVLNNAATPDAVLSSNTQKVIAGQRVAADVAKEAKADQFKALESTDNLRKEFNSAPPVKDWMTVQPILQSAREAMKVDSSAADLNLIYAFAKTMDPGSVVRESETAMAGGTGAAWDKAQGLWASVVGGQRLTPNVRAALMAEVESRGKGLEASYGAVRRQMEGVAKARGLPAEQIFADPMTQGVPRQNGATGGWGKIEKVQ